MFERITIDLTKHELETLIQEKIKEVYGQHCNVTFDVGMEYSGYGPSETQTPAFHGAKVSLVPKNGSNQKPV